MSSALDYRAEVRADKAAAAEQRRLDAAAAERRRAERRQAEDERERRVREQRRADKAVRRGERAGRRAGALTAGNVYRTGTLALVVASGLASLPAQVLHFVGISVMLLPLPFALEGAAWVMAAGVAYADARSAPASVRWLLRALVVAAAAFAASVNYSYGTSLDLPAGQARAAGMGLAAVTLLGPLLFEIRQWVSTLTPEDGPEERARRRHARERRRHHRAVARVADRLRSAAAFGVLSEEDAWQQAWAIQRGTSTPGMTPRLHKRAAKRAGALEKARAAEAEAARQDAESARQRAKDARQEAEAARQEEGAARQRAEEAVTAAREEVAGLAGQRDALAGQIEDLNTRTSTARQEAESARQRAEDARQEAEAARQRAEGSKTAVQEEADQARREAREALDGVEHALGDRREELRQAEARLTEAQGRCEGLDETLRQLNTQIREAGLLRERLGHDLASLSAGAPESAVSGDGPLFRSEAKQAGWQDYLTASQNSGGQSEPTAAELAGRYGISPGNARNWLTDFRTARAAQLSTQ